MADEHSAHALPAAATDPAPTPARTPVDRATRRRRRPAADALDTALHTPPAAVDNPVDTGPRSGPRGTGPEPSAVSVWTTAQTSPAAQRKGRYVPASTAHPAKMLPAVAAHAIAHYTGPGDLVLDPMCGIGTTLVEALHLGRHAVGVEYEPHWVDVATANLALAHDAGARHEGRVFHGDARQTDDG